MSDKSISPGLKTALDLGPILLFFAGYILMRDRVFTIAGNEYSGFILVTACFIPLLALTTFLIWRLTGKLSKMQLVTLVLVIVFGGLTIWLNDERFFKMKPTFIYLIFGGTLLFGLLRGKSWLSFVLSDALPLSDDGWRKLTWRVAAFFLALAVLNELIWRSMSTDAWVSFKTFGLPASVFIFFMAHAGFFQTHAPEADTADGDADADSDLDSAGNGGGGGDTV